MPFDPTRCSSERCNRMGPWSTTSEYGVAPGFGAKCASAVAQRCFTPTTSTAGVARSDFARLSARFCLSVRSDCLLIDWRGDLSDIACPFGHRPLCSAYSARRFWWQSGCTSMSVGVVALIVINLVITLASFGDQLAVPRRRTCHRCAGRARLRVRTPATPKSGAGRSDGRLRGAGRGVDLVADNRTSRAVRPAARSRLSALRRRVFRACIFGLPYSDSGGRFPLASGS